MDKIIFNIFYIIIYTYLTYAWFIRILKVITLIERSCNFLLRTNFNFLRKIYFFFWSDNQGFFEFQCDIKYIRNSKQYWVSNILAKPLQANMSEKEHGAVVALESKFRLWPSFESSPASVNRITSVKKNIEKLNWFCILLRHLQFWRISGEREARY